LDFYSIRLDFGLGHWIFYGTQKRECSVTLSFSSLADGIMAYLASRSHDWSAWQIEENESQLKLSILFLNPSDASPFVIEKAQEPLLQRKKYLGGAASLT
jgi:hypothetical protein